MYLLPEGECFRPFTWRPRVLYVKPADGYRIRMRVIAGWRTKLRFPPTFPSQSLRVFETSILKCMVAVHCVQFPLVWRIPLRKCRMEIPFLGFDDVEEVVGRCFRLFRSAVTSTVIVVVTKTARSTTCSASVSAEPLSNWDRDG